MWALFFEKWLKHWIHTKIPFSILRTNSKHGYTICLHTDLTVLNKTCFLVSLTEANLHYSHVLIQCFYWLTVKLKSWQWHQREKKKTKRNLMFLFFFSRAAYPDEEVFHVFQTVIERKQDFGLPDRAVWSACELFVALEHVCWVAPAHLFQVVEPSSAPVITAPEETKYCLWFSGTLRIIWKGMLKMMIMYLSFSINTAGVCWKSSFRLPWEQFCCR